MSGSFNDISCTDEEHARCIVINRTVYNIDENSDLRKLFVPQLKQRIPDISKIERGPELCTGTCLVRGEGSVGIYLVTGYPHTRRHRISSFEVFNNFCFDMNSVKDIPIICLEQIPIGDEIS